LRRTQASNRVNSLSRVQIENFNGVIAECADEQSLTRRIECEVIDTTLDSWQWNSLLEFKGFLLGMCSNDAAAKGDEKSTAEEEGVHLLP
jgi:hypothetical protein